MGDEKKRHVLKAEPGLIGMATRPKLPLRCGRCNGRTFQVIVTQEGNRAHFAGALCKCGTFFDATPDGYLLSSGEITIQHGEHNGNIQ